ncbi:MAG: chorismate synthase [Eubacterium sp.]|nr:chorismate synthase [Eubacterium sp.]MCM1217564.1 chorismate synthase [Lachnospiraceae bacterium]MCM1302970.1 chorismate synthase [Butyrivibrio sp.]MCM1344892.1 chorismate synthase [Muribaculaceae bacterium]MCM1239767.1 chorismate synthase [Lachnospiraceae bacterium]
MAGSTLGTIFKITTWGESHGIALGVVIDGCPAGLPLCEEDIQKYLDRRKPGTSSIATPRKEDDKVEILSGVFDGRTTGTPISLLVRNTSQNPRDYSEIASYYRPGHADLAYDEKYGFRDYRGGGRSSGRETIGRVAAGAIACKILGQMGITVCAYTRSIGAIQADMAHFDRAAILETATAMPDRKADNDAISYLEGAKKQSNSVGGIMECMVEGMPAGIGDPVFEKLDANLAKAVMSIGAVKAVEIGDGYQVSSRLGTENNDAYYMADGKVTKMTNHAGGILGGISDGSAIVIRAHVKPTPSIYTTQQTVNKSGEDIHVNIKGRHDPIVVPRAVVVMECMTALTILDAMLVNMSAKLDKVVDFYKR